MRANPLIALVGLLSAALPAETFGQDVISAFYTGKTITIIAGSSAGGGVDLYARLVSRHFANHIPGSPTVIVQNVPGAGSLAAARSLYSAAPKDGTQLAVVLSSALFDPLMSGRDLKGYDPRSFNYLGNANADTSVCVVRKDAAVQTYADVFEKELVVAGTGPGSGLVDFPVVERNLLHAKIKIIIGYRGSNEIKLAVNQNEVQGVCGLLWSSAKQQYPDLLRPDSLVKVLVQEDTKPIPALASMGVPRIIDFAKTADQKSILSVFLDQGSISRPFMLPPGVPPERVMALRKAFVDTMQDPRLAEEAGKQQLDINYQSGDAVQALVTSLYATPSETIKALQAVSVLER
jgi:tripartite-type tricarboxylate transporter receptor subunit TctC